jgi:predicted phosphoadenosine phosphosulfate sulfurtransferase
MSEHDTKQDRPGAEWIREDRHRTSSDDLQTTVIPGWKHIALGIWEQDPVQCRAISAAAREYEYQRGVAFGQGLANASNFQHLMRGIGQ